MWRVTTQAEVIIWQADNVCNEQVVSVQTKTKFVWKAMHQLQCCTMLRQRLPHTETCSFQSSVMLPLHDESRCWQTSSLSKLWYIALVPMRNAYFKVKCTANGVSPFHRALTPSSLMIVSPQCQMPASQASQVQVLRIHRYTARTQQHLQATVPHLCTCQHGQAAVLS